VGDLSVEGTFVEGQELSLINSISDHDGIVSFSDSIQWLRDGIEISGENLQRYLLTQNDVGAAISAKYVYTDSYGTIEEITTDDSGIISNLNNNPAGAVIVSGILRKGEMLYANTGSISDSDGLGAMSLQWFRDGQPIPEATSESYGLTSDSVGSTISVIATYMDGFGFQENVSSAALGPVSSVGETVVGTIDVDILEGTAADDTIQALARDDTITGGAGNDLIDGGEGSDTSVYSGNQTSYTVRPEQLVGL